jgi:hypothetical protein
MYRGEARACARMGYRFRVRRDRDGLVPEPQPERHIDVVQERGVTLPGRVFALAV